MTQKLKEYYGELSDEKIRFISTHTNGLKDKQIEALFEQIVKEYPNKEYGLPEDEDKLLDLLVVKQKRKGVVWSHCRVCDSEYDYKFMFCPVCYRREGVQRNEYYVKTADEFPMSVIRYNCTYIPIGDSGSDCLTCGVSAEGDTFCKYFGRIDYRCNADDFHECPCRQCCVKTKHANRKFEEKFAQEKTDIQKSINIPLDKGGNKML